MAKTITREEFHEGAEVCRRIFHDAKPDNAGKDLTNLLDQFLVAWLEGLEGYLFDDDPPTAE